MVERAASGQRELIMLIVMAISGIIIIILGLGWQKPEVTETGSIEGGLRFNDRVCSGTSRINSTHGCIHSGNSPGRDPVSTERTMGSSKILGTKIGFSDAVSSISPGIASDSTVIKQSIY